MADNMEVKINIESKGGEDISKKGINFLRHNAVYVGIPEGGNREGKPISNAELLFIHTNGSPVNKIPKRPVIEPALKDDAESISKMLKSCASLADKGKYEEAYKELEKIGMRAQNVCRDWFENEKNNWPPNTESVIRAKIKKGSTDPKPLIDTGELRKSITYFVDSNL